MPFGPYADFDACLMDQMKKVDRESAQRICGKMQAEMGGGNLTSIEEKDGDLYLKYFFADDSVARKVRNPDGSWGGVETPLDFNINSETLNQRDHEAVGLPFTILPARELSIYGDYHPWDPKLNATWEDHVAFARRFSPGVIEAITPNSNLQSAAVDDIKAHNGRFAVIHITNKEANMAWQKDRNLIPRQVSPGFMNLDNPVSTKNIRNLRWAHLAAVPIGAYGEKATLYGSCVGNDACVNNLVAGSVSNLAERITYCPVGASIMLTSLLANDANNHKMETSNSTTTDASKPNNTPATSTQGTLATLPSQTPSTANPSQKPAILRLKTQIKDQGGVQTQIPNETGTDMTELENVKKMVEEMRAQQEQNTKRDQLRKLIPKELFIMKGKFDEKGFEAEVEKRLNSNWDDATLSEYYNGKLELLKFGIQLPKDAAPNTGQEGSNPAAAPAIETPGMSPTGGSAYKTPSSVPDLIGGGSTDINTFNIANVRQLLGRFVRPDK